MVNYFIYATDDSGSTNGNDYFNKKGLETLQNFKDEVKALQNSAGSSINEDSIVYLHWSVKCVKVEEDEVVSRYKQQSGDGDGTWPHTVLDWITENVRKTDTIKLLYMITDGAVESRFLRQCDPNMKIDNVIFRAFNFHASCIDMSVASMFICNNKRYVVYCNERLVDESDLSTPFDYDQITVDTFNEIKDQLKSYIKLQFLTKSSSDRMALDEIKKLKRLRIRLFYELEATGKPKTPINLNVKDKESFIKEFERTSFYQTLMNPNQLDQKQVIESCINSLINYIHNDKKSFQFDNLKFSRKFTYAAVEEEVSNVDYENAEEISFPDIITLNETGIPVILLTHYNLIEKILFKSEEDQTSRSAHFSQFRKVTECPLVLLHDENFKNSIEYFYNLKAFKGMIEHGICTGPRTRARFTGAIVPLEQFDDYNDYILSCTYFAGRRVPYNKGLLYYVIYKTCEKLEYIEPNVVDYLKSYVVKRIAKTECYLGLSAISLDDPLIKVNLTTALWYCVELSSIIFKNDRKHFTKERMRMYCHFVEYMKEILEWFQYNIDTSSINVRAEVFKYLKQLKRIPRRQDKTIFILEQIFQKKDGFLVSEIVNPDNIYKLNYVKMDRKHPIYEGDIFAEVDLEQFAHILDHVEDKYVPLCRDTLRPHFVTQDNKSFYEHLKNDSKKVSIQNGKVILEPVSQLNLAKILSLYNLYILYVEKKVKYPTLEEFTLFVLTKKKFFKGKPVIFAPDVLTRIKNIYHSYQEIVTDSDHPIDVSTFKKITRGSTNRESRIRMENPVDFDMVEILDYIKESEGNVIFKLDESYFDYM